MLECGEQTTLDDFGCGILVKDEGEDYFNRKTEASNVQVPHTALCVSRSLAYGRRSFHRSLDHQDGLIAALQGLPVTSRNSTAEGSLISSLQRTSIERTLKSRFKLLRYHQRLFGTTLSDSL